MINSMCNYHKITQWYRVYLLKIIMKYYHGTFPTYFSKPATIAAQSSRHELGGLPVAAGLLQLLKTVYQTTWLCAYSETFKQCNYEIINTLIHGLIAKNQERGTPYKDTSFWSKGTVQTYVVYIHTSSQISFSMRCSASDVSPLDQ